jgi:hypothetical protein
VGATTVAATKTGTGRYQGARGTVTAIALGNDFDVTINLTSESTPTTGHRR